MQRVFEYEKIKKTGSNMNRFELFTMIFYALHAYYEEDVPEEINK